MTRPWRLPRRVHRLDWGPAKVVGEGLDRFLALALGLALVLLMYSMGGR